MAHVPTGIWWCFCRTNSIALPNTVHCIWFFQSDVWVAYDIDILIYKSRTFQGSFGIRIMPYFAVGVTEINSMTAKLSSLIRMFSFKVLQQFPLTQTRMENYPPRPSSLVLPLPFWYSLSLPPSWFIDANI